MRKGWALKGSGNRAFSTPFPDDNELESRFSLPHADWVDHLLDSVIQRLLVVSDLRWICGGPCGFALDEGEIVTVTGESGTGKTLLLRSLADLDPHEGEVCLRGKAAIEYSPCDWRSRVAYVANESFWWCARTGDHFAEMPVRILAELGFDEDVANWPVERLSAGEKQRLGLLRALQQRPEVLLLDEPTSNLDDRWTRAVERLIATTCREQRVGVVWISHDCAQVARVADRQFRLAGGGLQVVSELGGG